MLDVIGFGALNLDLIFRVPEQTANRLRFRPGEEYVGTEEEAETLLSLLRKEGKLIHKSGGGSAANTIVALTRLGYCTGYVGRVGEDPEGDLLLQSLQKVDLRGIIRGGQSGVCITLLLGDSSDRSLVVFPNTNDVLTFDQINMDYINNCHFLHLTSFAGEKPFETQKRALAELRPEVKVSFDPGMLYAKRGIEALRPLLERTLIFFPSKQEVEVLTGKGWEEGSRELLGYGPQIVVCSLGAKGVHIFTEDHDFHMPAADVQVVDTTGAGDVLVAGFLSGLLDGKSLRECAAFAVRIASQSTTGLGRQSYPPVENARQNI